MQCHSMAVTYLMSGFADQQESAAQQLVRAYNMQCDSTTVAYLMSWILKPPKMNCMVAWFCPIWPVMQCDSMICIPDELAFRPRKLAAI